MDIESLPSIGDGLCQANMCRGKAGGSLLPSKTSIQRASAANGERDIVSQADSRHHVLELLLVTAVVVEPHEERVCVIPLVVLWHQDKLRRSRVGGEASVRAISPRLRRDGACG